MIGIDIREEWMVLVVTSTEDPVSHVRIRNVEFPIKEFLLMLGLAIGKQLLSNRATARWHAKGVYQCGNRLGNR